MPGEVPLGDFDWNGTVESRDVDLLLKALRTGQDLSFDANGDGQLEEDNASAWVHDIKTTWFGDTNLDGEFNSGDLVQVFQSGEYEDATADNSTWDTGDWNADAEFTSADLVVALVDGGYQQGPRPVMTVVPEPRSIALFVTALIGAIGRRRGAQLNL